MAELTPAAQALKKACDDAFNDPTAKHSCSNAVWDVVKALVNKDEPYRTANTLIAYLIQSPLWKEVKEDEIGTLANQGLVVIGGKTEPTNGHVIVVYPGDQIRGGGYLYPHTDKKTGKKQMLVMPSHGTKQPCLSTSLGPWPGAMSDGDKTVFDPWGNAASFAQVRFWVQVKK